MTAKRFLTDDDKTELSQGIQTANNNSTEAIRIARELSENVGEGAMTEIAEFYKPDTGMSADDLTVGVAIVPISETVNAELFALFGGSFAYVMTMFDKVKDNATNRAQIALPYNGDFSRSTSRFHNGTEWSEWQEGGEVKTELASSVVGEPPTISPEVTAYVDSHTNDKKNPHGVTAAQIGARPNANLLHNWYFGNPVNGKGLSVYNSSGYKITIDRWMAESSCITNVNKSNITLETATDIWSIFYQQIRSEVARQMVGRKVTYSVLVDSIETGKCRAYIYNGSSLIGLIEPLQVGMNSVTFDYSYAETVSPTVRIQLQGLCKVSVKAMKLELGDKQTLAHQDNDGNWVLNEIPDYAEQVAICQQYSTTDGSYIGNSVPAWYPITTLTNGVVYDNTSCGYWVYGKQVTVAMRIASGLSLDAGTEVPLFTLPVGFRPSRHIEVPCACRNSNYNAPIKAGIKSDGTVLLYNSHTSAISTPSNITFEATFFIE